jgi:hypothetical protein
MKNEVRSAGSEISPRPSSQVDDALRFLRDQPDEEQRIHLSPQAEKELVKKIDWMLMLLMAAMYNLQYLDKTIRTVPSSPSATCSVFTYLSREVWH